MGPTGRGRGPCAVSNALAAALTAAAASRALARFEAHAESLAGRVLGVAERPLQAVALLGIGYLAGVIVERCGAPWRWAP